ncbi:MAG: folate family ECF transporter S component [Lactobacillus sp.]
MKLRKLNLQETVFLGLLTAVDLVLQKLSFGPVMVKVGLGFIGASLLGYFFGPWWGSVGALACDLLSSALFGQEGGFFIGFTISAMLSVAIYGAFYYQRPVKIWRIVAATLLVTVVVNILLNTLWLHLMYGLAWRAALITRLPKELLVPWLQMAVSYLVLKALAQAKVTKLLKRD